MKKCPYPKTVLVTGASSGIGKETADLFAMNGFTVYAASRHPVETKNKSIIPIAMDVTDIASIAKSTEFNCRPDAICVSGLTAGAETDTQVLAKVKESVSKTPVMCNTGCNKDNVVRQISVADGVVCATTFKVDGKFENPVDESRVKEFMDVVKEYRKTL